MLPTSCCCDTGPEPEGVVAIAIHFVLGDISILDKNNNYDNCKLGCVLYRRSMASGFGINK